MKPGIHPDYRPVLFHDVAASAFWLIRSTIETDKTTCTPMASATPTSPSTFPVPRTRSTPARNARRRPRAGWLALTSGLQVLLPSRKKPLSDQGKRLFQPIIAPPQAAQVS